jgi:ketosteroid isomerase-like protein
MSQENVEIVRRFTEYWNDRDWAALRALHHPNVVVLPPDGWPDGEVSRGPDAWIRQIMRLKDSWESDRSEIDQVHEAGSNVLVRHRWTTQGKDSGIGFETGFWVVFTLDAGTITRIQYFLDRSRALKAVGLSEQDAHG